MITDKTTIKGGKTQFNLHDGRNSLVDKEYSSGDVIVVEIPEQTVNDHIKFESGTVGLITGGKHIGELGRIKEINITKSSKPNTVEIETDDGTFLTLQTTFLF